MTDLRRLAAHERAGTAYARQLGHVWDGVGLMRDGTVFAVVEVAGFPHEMAGDEAANARHAVRAAVLRNIADEDVGLVEHLVRHDDAPPFAGPAPAEHATPYGAELARDYAGACLRGLMTTTWLVTVLVRPTFAARGWRAVLGLVPREEAARPGPALDRRVARLEDRVRALLEALAPLAPRRLGVRVEADVAFSEIAEAHRLVLYARRARVPMVAPGSLGASIYTERVVCSSACFRVEAAGVPETARPHGLMLGFRVYPNRWRVGMFDALLALPFRFVLTNSYDFHGRTKAGDKLAVRARRMENVGDRAASLADELDEAIDAIDRGEHVMGSHHWSLAVHADGLAGLEGNAAAARSAVTDAGAVLAAEDVGMEAAYWAQLPGAPVWLRARAGALPSVAFAAMSSLHAPPRGDARHHWGRPLYRARTTAGTAYDAPWHLRDVGHRLRIGPTGSGKCLARATPVLMFDGTTKAVEEVVVGDRLMGPDSRPRRVVSLARGREEMFRVTPTRGEPYTVNRSHILSLRMTGGSAHSCGIPDGTVVNLTVNDYLTRTRTFRHCTKGWRAAVDFPRHLTPCPLPPYLLGIWLGDGCSFHPLVTTGDPEIVGYLEGYAAEAGMQLAVTPNSEGSVNCHLTLGPGNRVGPGVVAIPNPVKQALRDLGVRRDKHIPHRYRTGSREERLELLAGILDTDGYLSPAGGYDLCLKSERLIDDAIFIARSLGFSACKAPIRRTCTNNGIEGSYWRCTINGPVDAVPCRIGRKRAPPRRQIKDPLVTGITVESVGEGEYFGFALDGPNRLFLLGDFTVTHNTMHMAFETVMLDPVVRARGGRQIVFDKDGGNEILVRAMGGAVARLRRGEASGAAPLRALPDTEASRAWLHEFLTGLIMDDGRGAPAPEDARRLALGLAFVMRLPAGLRSVAGVREFLGHTDPAGAGARLERWCRGGPLGWAFDGEADLLDFGGAIASVDPTALLADGAVMPPMAAYLLHRASLVVDGRPTVVHADEFRAYLPDLRTVGGQRQARFDRGFEDFALTGRKLELSLDIATQQPEHILDHPVGPSLVAQCKTRALYRNPDARRGPYVEGLGCTERVFHAVSRDMLAGPHSFVLMREDTSVLLRLDLSPLPGHVAVLSGRAATLRAMAEAVGEHGTDPARWLPAFRRQLSAHAA